MSLEPVDPWGLTDSSIFEPDELALPWAPSAVETWVVSPPPAPAADEVSHEVVDDFVPHDLAETPLGAASAIGAPLVKEEVIGEEDAVTAEAARLAPPVIPPPVYPEPPDAVSNEQVVEEAAAHPPLVAEAILDAILAGPALEAVTESPEMGEAVIAASVLAEAILDAILTEPAVADRLMPPAPAPSPPPATPPARRPVSVGRPSDPPIAERAVAVMDRPPRFLLAYSDDGPAPVAHLEPEWGAAQRTRSLLILVVTTLLMAAAMATVVAIGVEVISIWASHAVSKSAGT